MLLVIHNAVAELKGALFAEHGAVVGALQGEPFAVVQVLQMPRSGDGEHIARVIGLQHERGEPTR